MSVESFSSWGLPDGEEECIQCCKVVPLYTYWGHPRYYEKRHNMCKECYDVVLQGPAKKACNTCKVMLPLCEYYTHATGRDGYTNKCKECARRSDREVYNKRRSESISDDIPEGQEELPAKRQCPSHLYIMCLSIDPGGLVYGLKIGRSNKIDERARDLTAALPFDMVVLATFPGAGHLEEAVHEQLDAGRNTDSNAREWFRVPLPEALIVIAAMLPV